MRKPENKPNALAHFEWQVAVGGYRWVKGCPLTRRIGPEGAPYEWFLTDNIPAGQSGKYQKYTQATKSPDEIFRQFAELQPRRDHGFTTQHELALTPSASLEAPIREGSIVAFANRYGLLTRGEEIQVVDTESPDGLTFLTGESVSLWEREHQPMKEATDLWRKVRPRDLRGLKKVIRWQSPTVVRYEHEGRFDPEIWNGQKLYRGDPKTIQNPGGHLLKQGEFEKAAWVYLSQVINAGMANRVSPRLTVGYNHEDRSQVQALLRFAPINLLGWLWLLFAGFLYAGEFRPCKFCGRPFVIDPGVRRGDSLSCSASCRVRDSQRKAQWLKDVHLQRQQRRKAG